MLKRVERAFETIAPLSLSASWDNTGTLVEAPFPNSSSKILLTIDLSRQVLEESVEKEIGVIVAYHPFLFSKTRKFTLSDQKQRIGLICAAKGISVYSPHTCLDHCENGINEWIASLVSKDGSVSKITPFTQAGAENCGEGVLLKLNSPQNVDSICQNLKVGLGLNYLRRAIVQKQISTIAICAGSGSSVLEKAKGVDLWITGEMSHHEILHANELGTRFLNYC